MRDFGKDVFWGLTKSETHCQIISCISFIYKRKVDAKTVWNSLELLLLLFFNGTFFGLRSGPLDFFWARV